MKEVEIKIKVNDFNDIKKKFEDLGCIFSEAIEQSDMVYIPNSEPGVPVPPGTNVLRIRKQKGKTLFTLKQGHPGNHLAKLERELEILDSVQMDDIIKLLGFKEIALVNKKRIKGKIKEFEICLDEVEGLGSYLEMEKMTAGDPAVAQQEMLDFLSGLDINISAREKMGYDVLIFQKIQKL